MNQWLLRVGLLNSGVAMLLMNVDPQQKLIDINATLAEIRLALPTADRSDFESIYPDHTILNLKTANAHFEEQLRNHGLSYHEVGDESLRNFYVFKDTAQYQDVNNSAPDWARYCDHACLTRRLKSLEAPGGCQLQLRVENIGKSHKGRTIWAVGIMSPNSSAPEVLMAANIHGNEPVGGQILQHWIWNTCKDPLSTEFNVAKVVNAWYIPMLNPDGFQAHRRDNGVADLNRDMPIPPKRGNATTTQPETQALISFEDQHSFVTSLMFHGGAMVVNTIPDSCHGFIPPPCPPGNSPDDDAILGSAKAYANEWLKHRLNCGMWQDCIVKGADWYQITGSVQDYDYYFKGTLGVTVELSAVKFPPAHELPNYYAMNNNSIAAFLAWPNANPQITSQMVWKRQK